MRIGVSIFALGLALASPVAGAQAGAQNEPVAMPERASAGCPWRAAWASAQMLPDAANALPAGALADGTLRQIVRPSIGGARLRVRFSNVFGKTPLRIGGATLARSPGNGTIMLWQALPREELEISRFEQRLQSFVDVAEAWANGIREAADGAEVEPPADAAPEFMIRG